MTVQGKKLLSIFERRASQSDETTYLFYSAKAAAKCVVYTGSIPDGQGGKKTVTFTYNVTDPASYLWDDKQPVASCALRDLTEVKVRKPASSVSQLKK